MTEIEDTIQYIADLRAGEIVDDNSDHPECGEHCILFGIEMGYYDMGGDSLDVCGCEREERGYEIGRELAGNPVTKWEGWVNYIKELFSR